MIAAARFMPGVVGVVTTLLALPATPVAAAPLYTLYDCTFPESGRGMDAIAPRLGIFIDEKGKALVLDGIIQHFKGGPIAAQVRKLDTGKPIFSWTVPMPNVNGRDMQVDYQLRVPREGGAARISANPRGYDAAPTGSGSCKVEKNVRM